MRMLILYCYCTYSSDRFSQNASSSLFQARDLYQSLLKGALLEEAEEVKKRTPSPLHLPSLMDGQCAMTTSIMRWQLNDDDARLENAVVETGCSGRNVAKRKRELWEHCKIFID